METWSLSLFFCKKGAKSYVALYLCRAFGCGIGLGRV